MYITVIRTTTHDRTAFTLNFLIHDRTFVYLLIN